MQEAQDFTQQIQERAINLIDTLALQLGVAAEHVYTVLAKQVILEGWVILITILVGTLMSFLILGGVLRYWYVTKDYPYNSDRDMAKFFTIFGSSIAVALFVLSWFIAGPEAIMRLINPEYYVIKELLSVL